MTRTQNVTLPSAPRIVSPIDHLLWLFVSGHGSDTVLLCTPVDASSANEGNEAAATVDVITFSDGVGTVEDGETGLVAFGGGVDDGSEDDEDELDACVLWSSASRPVRELIVAVVDTLEPSVEVLCVMCGSET